MDHGIDVEHVGFIPAHLTNAWIVVVVDKHMAMGAGGFYQFGPVVHGHVEEYGQGGFVLRYVVLGLEEIQVRCGNPVAQYRDANILFQQI